jgi:glycosyltransferase involved in cell wall biosynthesis
MALGIPAVVSPVGVNTKIVDHSINGFICETEQEWFDALDKLLSDEALRINMAKQTRSKIELNYSVHSNETNFLGLFN